MIARLSARGVTLSHADSTVLDAVTLVVEPGEFVAIVGPNGAGKSTLLKVLLGLLAPSCGDARLGDAKVRALPARSRAAGLAWLPQRDAVVEAIRVIDRVAAARFRFDEPRADALAAAQRALDDLDIADLGERLADTLSGGEAQRVALAALAVQEADWWLLDEPAHHLDPARQVDVYQHLGRRWGEGQGILCVTHDVNLLRHAAPGPTAESLRIVGLADGAIRFSMTLADARLAEALSALFGVGVRAVEVDGVTCFVVVGEGA